MDFVREYSNSKNNLFVKTDYSVEKDYSKDKISKFILTKPSSKINILNDQKVGFPKKSLDDFYKLEEKEYNENIFTVKNLNVNDDGKNIVAFEL